MQKIPLAIIVSVVVIIGAIFFVGRNQNANPGNDAVETANNVTVVDGVQIIEITAKGGYSPKVTTAKAGLPTTLKVKTKATFDCSSALTIPSIGYRKNLPPTGETAIELPAQEAGSTLQGICAMGMYNFSITFS
jgi:plastocyanin domain-containing protein